LQALRSGNEIVKIARLFSGIRDRSAACVLQPAVARIQFFGDK